MTLFYFAITSSTSDQNDVYPIRGWDTQEADSIDNALREVQFRANTFGYLAVSLPTMTAEKWTIEFRTSTERGIKNKDKSNQEIVDYSSASLFKSLKSQQDILESITDQKKSLGVYFQPSTSRTDLLFPSDDSAYANTLQEAQTVQLGAWTDGTQCPLADGTFTPMNSDDIVALFKKLASYRSACQNNSVRIKTELETNLDIDMAIGWPDNH